MIQVGGIDKGVAWSRRAQSSTDGRRATRLAARFYRTGDNGVLERSPSGHLLEEKFIDYSNNSGSNRL